jgi:hypothetical protein
MAVYAFDIMRTFDYIVVVLHGNMTTRWSDYAPENPASSGTELLPLRPPRLWEEYLAADHLS